ncbi:MAG: guanylate kinase [Planctomycetaceae bacterium]|nr:guanylate kinase [Planctomycetaceae bacterium]
MSSAQVLPNRFRVVVLSGPSGSGKTTVVERLLEAAPLRLVKSISATTRAPRNGEVDGESYYFLSPQEFAERKAREEFLETAEVFGAGYWYGTLKTEVDRAQRMGGWSFLEIDVQGALRVMELYPDAVTIFLHPPSMEECERRLRSRASESEEAVQKRLRQVQEEIGQSGRYRYQVINDRLDDTIAEISRILRREAGTAD